MVTLVSPDRLELLRHRHITRDSRLLDKPAVGLLELPVLVLDRGDEIVGVGADQV